MSQSNKRLIGIAAAAAAIVVCVAMIVAKWPPVLPKSRPTDTAQEQVRNLYKATLDGDENAFLSCFAITDSKQREFVESGFLVARSEIKLRSLVTNEYGADAWDRLQQPAKNDAAEFHASLSAPTAEGYKALDSLPAPTEEDSYNCSGPGGPLELRRTNGWLVVIPPGDYGTAAKLAQRMRAAVDKLNAQLESGKMSFEAFHKNFNSAMADAWGFDISAPN